MLNPYTLPAAYNPGGLSGQQIANLINNTGGVAIVSPRIRLLDRDLNPVPVGSGAASDAAAFLMDPADITGSLMSCKVQVDTTQQVHRQATITLKQPDTYQFDTLKQRVEVRCNFWDPATGKLLLDVPLGIYRSILPKRTVTKAGVVWEVTLQGLTASLGKQYFLNPYVVPAGITYTQAILNLLTMDYLPRSLGGTGQTPAGCDDAGPGFSLNRINITHCGQLVPAPITFDRTVKKGDAILQLCKAINYWPPWDDEQGTINVQPMPYYTQGIPEVGWNYTNDRTSTIQPGSIVQTFDNQEALGNVVVVLSQHPAGDAICSVAYNRSPASRISIDNVGEALYLQPVQDTNIPDQATADLRGLLLLQQAAVAAETITWGSGVNPLHQTHDCLAFWATTSDGQVQIATSATVPWQEISYAFDFSQGGGSMTHAAGKMVAV